MTETATAEIQTTKPLRTGHVIMADGSKTVPTQIEIIKAGVWPATSVKGPLTITTADLQEFKSNFDAGIGMPAALKQLPIDFGHNDWKEAAGWIKSLEVVGESLMANVEWTAEGLEALEGGMYKCISPSFWPACCGEWYDPENSEVTARNVLVGAGLTNIPFFKDLQPIMASNASNQDGKKQQENIIYINANVNKEHDMTLDEIRVKEADQLTDDEKAFVAEHKSELSADEQAKFNVAEKTEDEGNEPAPGDGGGEGGDQNKNNEEAQPVTDPELAAINADIKSGKKLVVEASTFNNMQKTLTELQRKDVKASVEGHLQRGAIKADQVDAWTDKIVADASMEDMLKNLPDNTVLAGEIGSSTKASTATAWEKVEAASKKLVDDAPADKPMTFDAAMKKVLADDPTLAQELNAERQ